MNKPIGVAPCEIDIGDTISFNGEGVITSVGNSKGIKWSPKLAEMSFEDWLKMFYPKVELTKWQKDFIKASADNSIIMMTAPTGKQSDKAFIINRCIEYWETMGYLDDKSGL